MAKQNDVKQETSKSSGADAELKEAKMFIGYIFKLTRSDGISYVKIVRGKWFEMTDDEEDAKVFYTKPIKTQEKFIKIQSWTKYLKIVERHI